MKHSTALSQKTIGENTLSPLHSIDRPWCDTELIHLYDGFWSDIDWGVNYCPSCDQIICCVGNGVHWWNYTVSEPLLENLERGRRLAKEQEQP